MLYKAYHKEIVGNVIAYIADRFYKEKNFYIYQMVMYKILAFFDFECAKQLGSPCLELDFRARPFGPVPEELYNNSNFEKSFSEFNTFNDVSARGSFTKQYRCTCTPDLSYLSDDEKNILSDTFDKLKNLTAKQISERSHKEIKAWQKAKDRTPNSSMLYADEFDREIFKLNENELTLPEYNFIQYNEFSNA